MGPIPNGYIYKTALYLILKKLCGWVCGNIVRARRAGNFQGYCFQKGSEIKPDNAISIWLFNHEMNKRTSTSMPNEWEKPKRPQLYTKNNSQLCKAGGQHWKQANVWHSRGHLDSAPWCLPLDNSWISDMSFSDHQVCTLIITSEMCLLAAGFHWNNTYKEVSIWWN